MRFTKLILSGVMLATPVGAQQAGPAPAGDAAAAFGARESVRHISLAPDGRTIAFVAPTKGQGNALYISSVTSGGAPKRILVATGDPERLHRCNWVSNARLVCNVYSVQKAAGEVYGSTRMIAVNSDGSNIKLVSNRDSSSATGFSFYGGGIIDWLPEEEGAVLVSRPVIPRVHGVQGRFGNSWDGFAVERVDTTTLATKTVVPANKLANEFLSDGHGNVRIMGLNPDRGATGYNSSQMKYVYRPTGSEDWKALSTFDSLTDEGFNPLAVDKKSDSVIGLQKHQGRQALYRRWLDGSMNQELIYAHPEVDVDSVIPIGRANRVIGLTYSTDRRQSVYFDPGYAKLATALGKALPGAPLVNFEGATADEQQLLVWAGGDINPGKYFLFDRGSKKLNQLLLSRPELAGYKLAEVKSVSVRAGDGASIPAYLTLPPGSSGKNLPAIVMPHGGPSARDEWGFDWYAQFYANRGYAVLQPNFRGSSGYGDAWFRNNGFQSWKTAIGDVVDSGRWLVSEGIADPKRLAIVGWSYGGYAALQSGVTAPGLYQAIVAVAPVTDLKLLREQYRGWSSFANARDFIGTGTHLIEGSPTQNAAKISAPVMMFHGDRDMNVDVRHSEVMVERLKGEGKSVDLVLYPKLDHGLDDSDARADMLRRSDGFLRKALDIK